MGQDFGTCRACHQRVLWAVTSNGKSIPLDPEPDEAGNVAMMRNTDLIPCAVVLKKDEEPKPGEKRYQPHFATCPARKPPPTKAVNTARNKAAAARRARRYPAAPLPAELPANVALFKRPQDESLF